MVPIVIIGGGPAGALAACLLARAGMGVVLVYLEAMFLRTREPVYEIAAKFWTSLYAVTFAMGVATGIVMEFEFGTNWAVYSKFVGDVFGSALAADLLR